MTGPKKRVPALRRVADAAPLHVPLDFAARDPLHRQIYEGVRSGILAGRFAAGMRLPSTRVLASELGVARNTVVFAFDQLCAEGYLIARRGGGTRVRATMPDSLISVTVARRAPRAERSGVARISRASPPLPERWTQVLARDPELGMSHDVMSMPFTLGMPAVDVFPSALWARITARRWRKGAVFLGHAATAGDEALRNAIAAYVTSARGVRCTPDQILIVSGAQQALDLAARVLVEPGDDVWMEDPGYAGARAALAGAGARVTPVPVDDEGMNIALAEHRAPGARLAYVTPSHQFPLGTVMSASRRLALLTWAHRVGGWVLEDDYDSEFRYSGRPIPCLQGLDMERGGSGRVLYVGTFSKSLFPALRLGYLLSPPALVGTFRTIMSRFLQGVPSHTQGVVAEFIDEGHFAVHVRRMRHIYFERHEALLAAAGKSLSGLLNVVPAQSGLHTVGYLAPPLCEADVSHEADQRGITASPIGRFAITPLDVSGLVLEP